MTAAGDLHRREAARLEGVTGWLDLASPSHPFLFGALVDHLPVETTVTVREKTETVDLAESVGLDASVVGRDFDNVLLRKVGIPLRTAQLSVQAPEADVSLSARNAMCVLASKAQGVPSIHFTDNDITAHVDGLPFERLYNRLEAMATHNVVPAAFETTELTTHGADPGQVHTYDGYKEDVYVADLTHDPTFTDALPFEDYVVVRPEALDAAYVDGADSLVPELLRRAVDAGLHVVYLPRGRGDEAVAEQYPDHRVFVPDQALDGRQLSWHARCVLTGSGTMAREAACMQKPAVSFFPNTLLSVDQQLVAEGRMLHSRDAAEIVDFVISRSAADVAPDLSESKRVRAEVADLVIDLVERSV
jgi:predicted glycosyltransferase